MSIGIDSLKSAGLSWFHTLNQTEKWGTEDGRTLALDDMEPAHRRNLQRWLLERADGIEFRYSLAEAVLMGEMEDRVEDMVPLDPESDRFFDSVVPGSPTSILMCAQDWLRTTPFFQRLVELSPRPTDPPAPPLPGEDA